MHLAHRPHRLVPGLAASVGVAVLPKCPLCLLAWAGVAGSAGFARTYEAWLAPATVLALALTVGALAWGRGGRGPALLAAAGAAGVLAGRFRVDSAVLVYAGLAVVAAAVAWRTLVRDASPPAACPPCASAARSIVPPSSSRP